VSQWPKIDVRLPAPLLADFRRIVADDDRTVSEEVRRLIRIRVAAERDAASLNDERPPSGATAVQDPAAKVPEHAEA
jgi:hypothetical protein